MVATLAAWAFAGPGTAGATCDSSAFHLTVTDVNGEPATEPAGSALPAHRLPDGGVGEGYYAQISITGGAPPYNTGYGGYSLPPGIDKSISSSPGTSNNDIVTISGTETGGSYGASLILTVLDKNGCGPTPADSRFDWLFGETPTNTGPSPSIPDPITVGDQPTCDPGGWTGDANFPSITFKYEWRRTNADGTTTTVGSGQGYTTAPEDGGMHLECVVNATNQFGSTQAISNSVRVRYPPMNVTPPQILHVGPLVARKQAGCDEGSWAGASPISYSYKWVAHRADGDHTVATSPTYTPGSADVGAQLECTVTATNQDGSATASSLSVAVTGPAHLTLTNVVLKGWRATGNAVWMREGGPESAAKPQSVISIDNEAILIEVTVTNTGQSPSVADPAAIDVYYRAAVPVLQPGQSYTTTLSPKYRVTHVGEVRLKVGVRATPSDQYDSYFAPITGVEPPTGVIDEETPLTVGGSLVLPPDLPPADKVEVDISIVRSREAQVMRVGSRSCHWVAGTNGRLKSVKAIGGVCETPIWIRATVHRGKWNVRFKHPLPRGSYVLYTRAFDKSKAFDPVFNKKLRNRLAFRVR